MKEQDIREAVEVCNGLHKSDEFCELPHQYHQGLSVLLNLATAYLNVKDLPEKERCPYCSGKIELHKSTFEQYQPSEYMCDKCTATWSTCMIIERDKTIDLCKVVIARDYIHKDEVEKMLVAMNKTREELYVKRDEVEKLMSALEEINNICDSKHPSFNLACKYQNINSVVKSSLNSDIIIKENNE